MNNPPEHTNIEELVGLSPRSDVSDDYLAGASPQMSEDEDAAETEEQPPDNMPEYSHPSFIVSLHLPSLLNCSLIPSRFVCTPCHATHASFTMGA